ncbi:MAG: helix-turn-helix transcriptional regulator [Bryobacteraceae bacterium]
MRTEDALQIEHGSLYPALHRLERQGWVASAWKMSEANRGRHRGDGINAVRGRQLPANSRPILVPSGGYRLLRRQHRTDHGDCLPGRGHDTRDGIHLSQCLRRHCCQLQIQWLPGPRCRPRAIRVLQACPSRWCGSCTAPQTTTSSALCQPSRR